MELNKHIQDSVKDTVGYAECANKQSFLVGSSVAFNKAKDFYEPHIKMLNAVNDTLRRERDELANDMQTLVSIITKYQFND